MSYAGTYGSDETCPCGNYWRSCAKHSVSAKAINREADANAKHVREAEAEGVRRTNKRTLVLFDAECPGCGQKTAGKTKAEIEEWFDHHLDSPRKIANWPRQQGDGWRPFGRSVAATEDK